jgi:exopolysaccharide biosynthesis polyprenyl glycosylphosphotransferase
LLERALKAARNHDIEGVVLLSDLSDMAFVDRCVGAFSVLPVSIHLDIGHLAQRFNGIRLENVGSVAALALTEQPLAPLQRLAKRALDIVVAGLALVALSPAFGIIALLIKRDSKGPVFFTQRRRGYNQQEFRIFKFRSMTTMDDGDNVEQAKQNDPRITKVGALLRRLNLDELPQLINVLRGEMSIVGPRPHAVAHDRLFETKIGMYPRRLNVRPGITGWAQVHGLRGETDTDEKMAARVDHDLHYIDNWSLGLDLYILVLTVFSARTYKNAR